MRDSAFHPFNGKLSRHFDGTGRLAADAPYLSYHDVLLTKEDVDTLRYNDWLTDNVISFWEEYLERSVLAAAPAARIVLLRPSMAFLLTQTADPLTLRDALPALDAVTHIFLPVNDCRDPTRPEGGSHWSLLLVSVRDGAAFHYDSLASANARDARRVATQLGRLLRQPLRFRDLPDAPQQQNGSDCGVAVCAYMRELLTKRLLTTSCARQSNMSLRDLDFNAAHTRREMLKVIEQFRREGERRRSRSASPLPVKRRSSSRSGRSPPRIGDD